ncbi:MAG: LamG domain-containing protein [Kiritimatiellaeota bacterium]|nr:LamG domain-containing protein [Kiritimatiellota bacterium]
MRMNEGKGLYVGGEAAVGAYLGEEKVWGGAFHPLDLDPLVWWAFDGDLTDSSGNGFHLTQAVAATFSDGGVNGKCADTNTIMVTTAPYMNLLAETVNSDERETSFCWWSRKGESGVAGSYAELLVYGGGLTPVGGLSLRYGIFVDSSNSSLANGAYGWNTGTVDLTSPNFLSNYAKDDPLNVWTHKALTVGEVVGSDRVIRLYIDGVLSDAGVVSDSFVPTVLPMYLRNSWRDWCDVMIFKRALTQEEVGKLFGWRK